MVFCSHLKRASHTVCLLWTAKDPEQRQGLWELKRVRFLRVYLI